MSSDDIAISVHGVSKHYLMFDRPEDRMKQMVVPRLQRLLGREPRRYYRDFAALHDVSFEVRRGETVGILGRNGSGKSTLLQIVCGTLQPSAGEVRVRGRIAALLELGAGFNPEFTGRENAYLNAAILGIARAEIDARFDDIARFADIGQFIDQPVKTYSSGMYVRLAFAVAIHVMPDVLVIDEALAVGDEAFQRKCFARIDAMRNAGATVLFVSHSAGTVIDLCDRAILLDAGEILADGPPKNVVALYHKLLYSGPDRIQALREQIRHDPSAALNAAVDGGSASAPLVTVGDCGGDPDQGYFDEFLQPTSTVNYEQIGACICGPQLHAMDGRRVNVLMPGNEYFYRYSVLFSDTATGVRFGMMIRTVTGVEVCGSTTSMPGHGLPVVASGARLDVEFRFRCMLAAGTYFLNAGVLGQHGEQETYLDRRIDIAMFRVQSVVGRLGTGLVDMGVLPKVQVAQ